jgi:hypothetical protein
MRRKDNSTGCNVRDYGLGWSRERNFERKERKNMASTIRTTDKRGHLTAARDTV